MTPSQSLADDLAPTFAPIARRIYLDAADSLPLPKRVAAKFGGFLLMLILGSLIQAIVEILVQRYLKPHLKTPAKMDAVVVLLDLPREVAQRVEGLATMPATAYHPAVQAALAGELPPETALQ